MIDHTREESEDCEEWLFPLVNLANTPFMAIVREEILKVEGILKIYTEVGLNIVADKHYTQFQCPTYYIYFLSNAEMAMENVNLQRRGNLPFWAFFLKFQK